MTLYACIRQGELDYYRQVGLSPVGDNCALVEIDGCVRQYVKVYLSPKDCPKYGCEGWVVVAVDVVLESCYIAEGAFYSKDAGAPDCLPELFQASVIPVTDYRVGQYFRPVCLVPGTSPTLEYLNETPGKQSVLYAKAETIYVDRIFDELLDNEYISKTKLLELAYQHLAQEGKAKTTKSSQWDYVLYETLDGDNTYLRSKTTHE